MNKKFMIYVLIMMLLVVPVLGELTLIDLIPAHMTASSSFAAGLEADKAVDTNNATFWLSNSDANAWIKISFPEAKEVNYIDLQGSNDPGQGVYTFIFQWSDNDADWTNAHIKPAPVGETLHNYSFSNLTMGKHQYYRFYDVHRDGGSNYGAYASIIFRNGTIGSPTPDVSALLLNASKGTIPYVGVDESSLFYFGANYTVSGNPLIGGNCTFTGLNVSGHWFKSSNHNYTFNSSSDSVSITVSESNSSVVSDVIEFSICEIQASVDVQVLKDGNLYRTIPKAIIPMCSAGTHTELNLTEEFKNDSNINITLTCSGCIDGVKQVRLVNKNNKLLSFDRDFLEHTEPLTYNSSINLYEYVGHQYRYTRSGTHKGNVTVNCNGTTDSVLFNVTNNNLTVNVQSINGVSFTEGMNVESAETVSIIIEVTGDIVNSIDFNVTYPNGSLVKNSVSESISLSNDELSIDGIYGISIVAIDDDDVPSNFTGTFEINDTTVPVITWTNPLVDNSTQAFVDTNFTVSVSFTDLNLYAYNYSVLAPNGTIMANATIIGGISSETINLTSVLTLSSSGTWVVNLEVADNHHLTGINKVKDWKIKKEKSKLHYDDCVQIYAENSITSTSIKKDYYYNFGFEWDKTPYISKHIYVYSCERIDYIKDSKYKAHFVVPSRSMWIDFEGVKETPKVLYMGNNTYELTYYNLPNKIEFESIGGLNVVSQSTSFSVITPADISIYETMGNETPESWTRQLDLETTSGVLLLFFLLTVTVIITIIGTVTHPLVLMFAGIMWFFLGWIVTMNTSIIFGALMMIFGIIVIFGSMLGE